MIIPPHHACSYLGGQGSAVPGRVGGALFTPGRSGLIVRGIACPGSRLQRSRTADPRRPAAWPGRRRRHANAESGSRSGAHFASATSAPDPASSGRARCPGSRQVTDVCQTAFRAATARRDRSRHEEPTPAWGRTGADDARLPHRTCPIHPHSARRTPPRRRSHRRPGPRAGPRAGDRHRTVRPLRRRRPTAIPADRVPGGWPWRARVGRRAADRASDSRGTGR